MLAVLFLIGIGHLERAGRLDTVHLFLLRVMSPLERVINLPLDGYRRVGEILRGIGTLELRLEDCELKLLRREVDLQRLKSVQLENNRLRSLLHLVERDRRTEYQAAQILPNNIDEFDGKITLNLGKKAGISEGLMVVNARGILGQIVIAGTDFCRVLPIIHEKSAVPAVIERNGLEVVVLGTGKSQELKITGLTETADIVRGDIVVTSGRGGTFLPGYLIGRVTKIVINDSEKFLQITAVPTVVFGEELGQVLICKQPS